MRRTLTILVILVAAIATITGTEDAEVINSTDNFEERLKQVVWKRCALQLTPTCLKLTLVRLVDRLAEDTHFQPLPGVLVTSNRSRAIQTLPPASSRADLTLQQRLDTFLLHKVTGYMRSLTLSVNLLDLPSFNTTGLIDNVLARVTGRKDKGNNGIAALAMMFGGALMTMMMSALAAMAGKALMTSMMALMLAAMSAMKGGHGGGGKSTTYEIIAQPEVSHAHSHSSEVHHGHGWKRSVDAISW